MEILVKKPVDCTSKELDTFEEMVSKGGEVSLDGLHSRIESAKYLAFAYADDTVIGVSAIKIPRDIYKDKVFSNAGIPDLEDTFQYELGWVYVEQEYRKYGVGYQMVHNLLQNSGIFATVRQGNMGMQAILYRCGFRRVGNPYKGRGEYLIEIWGL